ncbi:MAG: DUF3108 domain-containing protein [Alphaproteobacteria bacterium]
MRKRWGFITNDKTRYHAFLLIASIFFNAGVLTPAFSNDADDKSFQDYDYQEAKYDVYAGGIRVVQAEMVMDFRDEEHYSLVFKAQVSGFLGALVPWEGTFETHGWALPGLERIRLPEQHISTASWRGEEEIKTYRYDRNKGFQDLTTLYIGKKPRKEKPEEELTKGTTDVISASLMVMEHVSDGKPCEGVDEVFDGKRRYKLIFHHKGYVHLKKTRYNVYEGSAVECMVEVEPVAGAWYSKPRGWLSIQEQGRSLGTMPTIWMAQITENAVVMPVRMRVKTAYGTLFMHMTEYKSGDTVLSIKDN